MLILDFSGRRAETRPSSASTQMGIRAAVPIGYVAEPADVAHAVSFLASDGARYVTGQTLLIDGGRWMV